MTPNPATAQIPRIRRLTLALPSSLVQALIRLAELRGRDFDQELAEDFAFLLRLSGGPRPATMLEHLFEVERLDEATERVATSLPGPLHDVLGVLARSYDTTRAHALTAIMHRGVRRLLAAQVIGFEQDIPFTEAYLALLTPELAA